MGTPSPILFYVDENQPVAGVSDILVPRGHQVVAVQVGERDPAILWTAEEAGAVIITADTWFLEELYGIQRKRPSPFRRAGVVLVPGTWDRAEPRLRSFLWLIESAYASRRGLADLRIGINLALGQVRVYEAR